MADTENPQLTWCFQKSKSYSFSDDDENNIFLENPKKRRLENPEKVKESKKRW